MAQDPNSRYFPETSHNLGGAFRDYWSQTGGLARHGFPISEPLPREPRPLGNGQSGLFTVQYFERSLFEWHPEKDPPFLVLLGALVVPRYHNKYPPPQGAPGQQANNNNPLSFSETSKMIGGRFRAYWEDNSKFSEHVRQLWGLKAGIMVYGLPLSDEFIEQSDIDGKSYRVQYFERAVFEYHPEYAPPSDVLLSQLGELEYREQHGARLHADRTTEVSNAIGISWLPPDMVLVARLQNLLGSDEKVSEALIVLGRVYEGLPDAAEREQLSRHLTDLGVPQQEVSILIPNVGYHPNASGEFNPDVLNPQRLNPDVLNPQRFNPDVLNPQRFNPDGSNI